MNVTNLRKAGKRLTRAQVERLGKALASKLKAAGFITDVHGYSTGGFSISTGGFSCFTVDPKKRGYNGRSHYSNGYTTYRSGCIADYKRTTCPTWDERVEFNNIVNRLLDFGGYTARIKSGPFIIRDVNHGAYTERAWDTYSVPQVQNIFKLTAEDVAEAEAKRRAHRRIQSRIARERKQGKLVEVCIMYGGSPRDVQTLTESEYKEWVLQLSTGDHAMHKVKRLYNQLQLVANGGAK